MSKHYVVDVKKATGETDSLTFDYIIDVNEYAKIKSKELKGSTITVTLVQETSIGVWRDGEMT